MAGVLSVATIYRLPGPVVEEIRPGSAKERGDHSVDPFGSVIPGVGVGSG
jgi:hypothetical protein